MGMVKAENRKLEIIAHRGARSLAPENTLAAAQKGFAAGAHRWETDVSLTKDKHPVLFHDQDLSRCTNAASVFASEQARAGRYFLSDFTLKELLTLDAGSHFIETDPFSTIKDQTVSKADLEKFRGQKIPTLDQGLALTRDLGWAINLELKDHGTEPEPYDTARLTLAALDRSGISPDQVVMSSFNHDWLAWILTKTKQFEVQALVGDLDTAPLDFKDFSFSVYNVNARLITTDDIKMLKARGKKINLFTVNEPDRAALFFEAGVDGIFTDFPQYFV